MTSPQLGLLPARSDDRLPVLTAAQLVARGGLELGQRARTEVGQRVTLEPGPQVFDRVEVRRVGRQHAIWIAALVLSRYARTMRLLCWAAPSRTISSLRLSWVDEDDSLRWATHFF